MTDRELLELAAKAAGVDGEYGVHFAQPGIFGRHKFWNPLSDDGDALRLAVKLTMELDVCRTGIAVRVPQGLKVLVDPDEIADPYAATRRAIVRAAAEIGRTME